MIQNNLSHNYTFEFKPSSHLVKQKKKTNKVFEYEIG